MVNRGFLFVLFTLFLMGCSHHGKLTVEGEHLAVCCDGGVACDAMEGFLSPYRAVLDEQMGSVLTVAVHPLVVERPEGTLNDFVADVMLERARGLMNVDFALTNVGGLRKDVQAGEVTLRDVYEVMPFDNELVVLTLKGADVLALCESIVKVGGEAVSGLRVVSREGKLTEARVGGEVIDADRFYRVATSDYLSSGNDKLTPLARHTEMVGTGLLLRDVFIDGFSKRDSVDVVRDGRVVIEK